MSSSPNPKRKRGDSPSSSPPNKRQKPNDASLVSSILSQLDFDTAENTAINNASLSTGNAAGSAISADLGDVLEVLGALEQQQPQQQPMAPPKHNYSYSDFEETMQPVVVAPPQPLQQQMQQNQTMYAQQQQFMPQQQPPQHFQQNAPQHDNRAPPSRPEDSTAFINGISPQTSRDELRRHFEECGPIESAVVALDKVTKMSKGHAFVNFMHPESVEKAIMMKDGTELCGATISVMRKRGGGGGGPPPQHRVHMGQPPQQFHQGGPPPQGMHQPPPYGMPPQQQGLMPPQPGYGGPPPQHFNHQYQQQGYGATPPPPANHSPAAAPSPNKSPSAIKKPRRSTSTERILRDEFLGIAHIVKKSEQLYELNMHCSNPDHIDFFRERLASQQGNATDFDLKRCISKKHFHKWYVSNKKHVRIMEMRSGRVEADYRELMTVLQKEHSMYVSSDSLKGCIVMASSLKGYPATQPVIGIFVRTSGKK